MGRPLNPGNVKSYPQSNLIPAWVWKKIESATVVRYAHAGSNQVQGFSGRLLRTRAHDYSKKRAQRVGRKD
tara:strand:- start:48 stop:260 length:213 start_codon:yes stop_codon:yes gene_type:complete